jgi:F0F1-type ATP synthase assembly protein I
MTAATPPDGSERSLSELVSSMSQDLSTLVRKELELAKEETRAEIAKVTRAGSSVGGAAAAGLYAGVALVMALGYLLDLLLPTGMAFLLVAVVLGAAAAVLAKKAQREIQDIDPAPQQTIETMKENAQWLSEQRN